MNLAAMIDDDRTDVHTIGAYLDPLPADARWRELDGLGRDRQRLLYEKAAHAAPIDLVHFVGDAGAREEVIHDGVNTLPLPPPLRRFQKRFCRPIGERDQLFGYNEGVTRRVIGPGFFVAVPTEGRPHWSARGP